jgi:carboxypeptidase family protein/TonB-dependent receptor-like protein
MNSRLDDSGTRRWRGTVRLLCLALSGVLLSVPVHAQIGANLSGVIADGSGGVLPGVTITITNTATGRAQTLVTSDEGRYRAVALQPGPYEIAAELQGFGTLRRSIVLVVGAEATVDITLGVATVAETVTVVGEVPLVEVAKSQPSSVITGEQIDALPVLSRNFLVLAQLMPGAAPARAGQFAVTKFGGPGNQRFGYITLIDGGDLHEPIWGHPSINLSQDSVAEFKVFRNQWDAEYSGALAAIVNVVTKSGTNRQSGSAYYFGRDDALNAKNAYATRKPPFQQVRVGASNGGAIVQSRTHYFVSYEQQKTESANITALPPSNPFATLENGIYPNFTKDKNLMARLDHRLNEGHGMYVRYAVGDWIRDDGDRPVRVLNGITLGALAEIQKGLSNSIVAEENWILSDSKLNTVRLHILNNQLRGEPHSFEPRLQRPSFTWGQFHRDPQWFPQSKYALTDTFFITGRGHDLKVGGEFTYTDTGFEAHHYENGGWIFNTDAPFDANNAASWPFSFEIRTAGEFGLKSNVLGAFAQDTWRLGDAINLNLGLRYDYETNIRDNENHFSMFTVPKYAGIDRIIDKDRKNGEFDNFQPRLGLTWNVRGDGNLVARAGWGYYITRNQPWFAVVSQQQYLGTALLITDPQRLRLYPDINAALGGRTVEAAAAAGGTAAPQILGNTYGRPRQATTTAGVSWQMTGTTSMDADYVRGRGTKQQSTIDRNLPEFGPISASNPRPVPTLSRVAAYEDVTKSSYDALEMQVRQRVRGGNSLQVSYTLSRTLLDLSDGTRRAEFFNNEGYNGDDTRHNLTASVSTALPWESQVSVIGQFISGYPKAANSGLDLDGDGASGDRPPGLPVTVGRGDIDEQLQIINDFRAARALAPFAMDVLKLYSYKSVNVRATKKVSLGQARGLEIFLEAFNVTNFVNRTGGGTNIRLATFGIPTGAADARQVQWGARVSF